MGHERGRRVQVLSWPARIRRALTSMHLVSALCVLVLIVGAVALVQSDDPGKASSPTAADPTGPRSGDADRGSQGSASAPADSAATAAQREVQQLAASRAKSIESLRAKAVGVAADLATPTRFRLQSYNVLGSGHTKPGGAAAGFASGRQRAAWTRDVVARLGSDVIGFQEVFDDQLAVLRGGLPDFAWYPGTSLGDEGTRANIGWDNTRFRLVEAHTLRIPFIRQHRRLPYVKLEDRSNKKQFWFFNIHNAPRNLQSQRNQNIAAEIAVIRQLEKDRIPIFMAGDFNENRDGISGPTSLQRAPGKLHIEQIYGTPGTLKNFIVHRDAQTRRATDHRVPYSDVVID